jgi:hypothetical protein
MKRKLTSRKFWVAVATMVSGILMMFGIADGTAETISGAIITVSGAVVYMIMEGKVDKQHTNEIIDGVDSITNLIDTGGFEIDPDAFNDVDE